MANMGVEVLKQRQARLHPTHTPPVASNLHEHSAPCSLVHPKNYASHRSCLGGAQAAMLRAWVPGVGRKAAAGWPPPLTPRRLVRPQPLQQGEPAPVSRCFSMLRPCFPLSLPHPAPSHGLQTLHGQRRRHLHILYRDAHIIVTNKAAGVLSQPDRQTDGVATDQLGLVRAYIKEATGKPGDAYVGLVHRLDRNVTGCMVIALRSKAAARLSYDFKHRLVSKTYVAMVVGKLRGAGMLADTLEHSKDNVTRVVGLGEEPHRKSGTMLGGEKEKLNEKEIEKALLHYKSLGTFLHPRGGAQTLVQIHLVTGKKHQIRAQLAHLGHPIVGDVKYNAPTRFRDKFLALHCSSLAFRHPLVEKAFVSDEKGGQEGGEGRIGKPTDKKLQRRKMTVHAPLPETWRARFGNEVVRLVETQQRSIDERLAPE